MGLTSLPVWNIHLSKSHQLGRWGESIALEFLEFCGYRCLEKQYRRGGGEIDLIVFKGENLAFVEVKTRGRGSLAPPEAWVNGLKLARMRRLARRWLDEHRELGPWNIRFDVIAVEFGGEQDGFVLRHYSNVV